MATHSSVVAWKIPGTEEPDGLQSTGLQRVRHNGAYTHTHTHTHTHTPNFLSRLDKVVPDKVKNEKRKCVEQDISLSGHHSKGHIILSYYREKTQ